jgi:hypothetical protein
MSNVLGNPDKDTLRILRKIAADPNDGYSPINTYARMVLAHREGKGLRLTAAEAFSIVHYDDAPGTALREVVEQLLEKSNGQPEP